MPPTCRVNAEIISVGNRARAWQYALVRELQRGQTADDPLEHSVIDRLPAAAIGRERLRQKHRQRLCRREQPLAMRRQQLLDAVKQLRTGQ